MTDCNICSGQFLKSLTVFCTIRIIASQCPAPQILVNGTCTECPAGFFGITCNEKCFGMTYGKQCRFYCNCTSKEKCHHIHGCISASDQPTVDRFLDQISTRTSEETTLIHRFTKESTTVQMGVTNAKDIVDNKQNEQWFHYIYGLIIAGMFLVVLVLLVSHRTTHTRRIEMLINEIELRNVTSVAQINSSNGAYEYVANNLMVHPILSPLPIEQIRTVEISESCSNTTQSVNDSVSCKNTYQTLLTDCPRDVHIYSNTDNAALTENDDYLDPYPNTYTYNLRRHEGGAKEFFVEEEISLD